MKRIEGKSVDLNLFQRNLFQIQERKANESGDVNFSFSNFPFTLVEEKMVKGILFFGLVAEKVSESH